MSGIDVIHYKTKRAIRIYIFVPFMTSKSTTSKNITIFKDMNIT